MKRILLELAPTVSATFRSELWQVLNSADIKYEVLEAAPDEVMGSRIPGRLAEGWDSVVAIGGDGTVAAIAHALVGTSVPLGIIPAGTGNLVARELGIPVDLQSAVALLTGRHTTRRIDAMRINQRTYLLNAGVGINAEVIDKTSRLGKSLFGRSAYVGTAVWKVLKAKPQRMEIHVDGKHMSFNATDIAISNCGILARALNPNGPDISVDDGVIDICVLCMKSPLEYPWYYFLRHIAPERVNKIMYELVAGKEIRIFSKSQLVVQADGDIIGKTPVTIEVLPQALSLVVPDHNKGETKP